MKQISLLSLALSLVASAALAAPLRIGLMAPLTGATAHEGREMVQIVRLLADEVNAAGGVLGKKVEIVAVDDAGTPQIAARAAQQLTMKDVVAVVGNTGSSVTEATQTIFDEVPLLQIASGATADRLTEKGLQYFLRTSPRDDEQGQVAAHMLKSLGARRVAILHDNSIGARGLAAETQALLRNMGVQVVFSAGLMPGDADADAGAVLARVRAADPHALFFSGGDREAAQLLRQKAHSGWDVPVVGSATCNTPELVGIAGTAAAGFHVLGLPQPHNLPAPRAKAFLARYRAKYGTLPDSIWAVLAGDAFLAATDAINGAKSTEAAKVATWLKKNGTVIDGLTGPISFNAKGDRVGDVFMVYRVTADGRFVPSRRP